jgi:hypothetical protein
MSLVIWSSAYAQSEQSEAGEAKNSLRAGVWALQFRINNNFTLGGFQGGVISLKHHRSARSAFRLGLSLGFAADDDQSYLTTRNDTVIVDGKQDRRNNRQNVRLDLQYVRYPNPGSRVNLFVGVGPLLSYYRNYYEQESNTAVAYQERTSWGVGASGQLGVEWFATKSISLHAEYGVFIQYVWSSEEGQTVDTTTRRVTSGDGRSVNFGASSLLFGLSAYF